jgi:GAF domain-containing protein
MLLRDEQLLIEASISVDPDLIRVGLSLPVDGDADLAVTVAEHVRRTREPVILADATRDTRFAGDSYVAAKHPKSVVCLPFSHQGRLTGILYLENNVLYDAFTPGRVELCGMPSSHAAVAVENALLYTRVNAITEELKRANEALGSEVLTAPRSFGRPRTASSSPPQR